MEFKKITSPDQIKTQRDAVVYHLIMLRGITSLEAFTEWGITRLADIIHKLRKNEGLDIASETKETKNRFSHRTTYARYTLTSIPNPTHNEVHTEQEPAV